ncbi:MAG: porin [Hydrocarboniphaga sp.]|uniref:OprO/OprP family phosphate-selective porin n=1 Tax=Hydrocarboniphaga sp. TaxID=2033016 RepID=UPI002603EBF9|nr:porin [Hydrocarboniphaga sp.]MDB5969217.1 porin [Hydrocarboniphaga sp.]
MKSNATSKPAAFVLSATAAALLASFAGAARAEDAPTTADLDQRIKVLERQLEIQQEDAAAKAKDAPVVTASDKGFSFKSPKGDYEFKFKGLVQSDFRYYLGDGPSGVAPAATNPRFNDTVLLRRVEPTFELTVGQIGFVRIQPQFNGSTPATSDVYGEVRLLPAFYVRAGKFKEPVVLENLQSTSNIEFIERSLVNEIGPNRDLGLQIGGEFLGGTTSYAFGYFNGAADGRDADSTTTNTGSNDVDNRKELAARLFTEPFKNSPGLFQGLGFGVGGSFGPKVEAPSASDSTTQQNFLPRYRSPGQNTVFQYRSATAASTTCKLNTGATGACTSANGVVTVTSAGSNGVYADGDETRISPQAYWYYNSFGLLGEYIISSTEVSIDPSSAKLKNKAWEVYASYLLTGEDATYRGVKVRNAFKLGQPGWGAFEIAARYAELEIDSDAFPIYANPVSAISKEKSYTVGVNWYLNNNVRWEINYSSTKFDGGGGGTATAPLDRQDEKALFGRFQLSF